MTTASATSSLASEGESASWDELLEHGGDVGVGLVRHLTFGSESLKDVRVLVFNVLQVETLEFTNVGSLDLIKISSDTGIEDANLLLSGHWHILSLLEELSELLTSVQQLLRGGIKVGTELGEGGDLSVLGKIELHGTGHLLHGLDLGGGADSGHGKTDVNGWSDTLVEELSFQEDLSIGNGDDIGWDIGGHITGLGLNNWEGSK